MSLLMHTRMHIIKWFVERMHASLMSVDPVTRNVHWTQLSQMMSVHDAVHAHCTPYYWDLDVVYL